MTDSTLYLAIHRFGARDETGRIAAAIVASIGPDDDVPTVGDWRPLDLRDDHERRLAEIHREIRGLRCDTGWSDIEEYRRLRIERDEILSRWEF